MRILTKARATHKEPQVDNLCDRAAAARSGPPAAHTADWGATLTAAQAPRSSFTSSEKVRAKSGEDLEKLHGADSLSGEKQARCSTFK